jgi:tetratricopeptide (TPR) repeat protein
MVTRVTASSQTLESTDERISQALKQLTSDGSAEAHRKVAGEYYRRGVLDQAHEHYTAATQRDPRDAASFDALARIWRDWGMPQQGLGAAHRAVRLAPESAAAANTLGTLLQATNQLRLARQWYARAIALDPMAAYALNNFCYALIMLEQPDAVEACRRAVDAAPRSPVARNNLGLAYAAAGDLVNAREQFRQVSRTAADYNMGILHMAMRDYRAAAQQFGVALQSAPQSTLIARRARQARLAADAAEGTR